MGGDRALVSLINNTLETYHINSPDSLLSPAVVASSSSQKKAKKIVTNSEAGAELAVDDDEEAGEDDEEEEAAAEKVDTVTPELIQSTNGGLVVKQAVLDLHGHR